MLHILIATKSVGVVLSTTEVKSSCWVDTILVVFDFI